MFRCFFLFPVLTKLDDIPIQGPTKEENGQLSSINEESESGGDGPKSGPGKVKDSKTHKVLVNFMKLKEKDKDKDDSGGGGMGGGGGNKKSSGGMKEKLAGKQSLQMQQQTSAELIEAERASPQTVAKRKSNSIDIINSMPSTGVLGGGGSGGELIVGVVKQSVPLSNGGVMMGADDKDGLDGVDRNGSGGGGANALEVGESFDSGNEMSLNNNINNNNNLDKSALDMKNHGSIQVSQV